MRAIISVFQKQIVIWCETNIDNFGVKQILGEINDSDVLEIRELPCQNRLLFGCAVYLIISCDQRIVFTKQTSKHVIQFARVYVETASQIHEQIIFHRKNMFVFRH